MRNPNVKSETGNFLAPPKQSLVTKGATGITKVVEGDRPLTHGDSPLTPSTDRPNWGVTPRPPRP